VGHALIRYAHGDLSIGNVGIGKWKETLTAKTSSEDRLRFENRSTFTLGSVSRSLK
jgi:hypothetical protein